MRWELNKLEKAFVAVCTAAAAYAPFPVADGGPLDLGRMAKFGINAWVNPEIQINEHLARAAAIKADLKAGKAVGYNLAAWQTPKTEEAKRTCRVQFMMSSRDKYSVREIAPFVLETKESIDGHTVQTRTMDLSNCVVQRMISDKADAESLAADTTTQKVMGTVSLTGVMLFAGLSGMAGFQVSRLAAHAHRRRENKRANQKSEAALAAAHAPTPTDTPNGANAPTP